MSSLHLDKDDSAADLDANLDTNLDNAVIPEDWKEVIITFHGPIDASMNVLFGTLGHRVNVEWGTIDNGATQGPSKKIVIHRHPDHGTSYLRQFLLGLKLQHPETVIAFTTKEKRSKTSGRNATIARPVSMPKSSPNSPLVNSPVSETIAEGWDKLRRVLWGNT